MFIALLLAAQAPNIVRVAPPVIIQAPVKPSEKFGSWFFYEFRGYAISSPTNQSSSAFGVICGKTCAVFVNLSTSCEKGHRYPVLVNSDAGSIQLNLVCNIVEQRYLLSVAAEGNILDAIEAGGEIGFALPLDGGKFNVSRFSLDGAVPAIKRTVDFAKAQKDDGKALKDFTL